MRAQGQLREVSGMKKKMLIVGAIILAVAALLEWLTVRGGGSGGTEATGLVPADVAWVSLCAGLVMLMTPAVGFFYGGLVRQKNLV